MLKISMEENNMGEIISLHTDGEVAQIKEENALLESTQGLLADARTTLDNKHSLSVPIAELSTLGAGVCSLIPALNTVTQTTTIAANGLYTLANSGVGDVLKVAKNGNFWGAFKTADGASKFAQLQAAGPISATTQAAAAFNPATMMMAVALFSIEQELGKIEEMQKQIISFLEIEKESEIEADVQTLMGVVRKYKLNWDNEHYVASNHKLVLDIQRTARKNMNAYQKKVAEIIGKKQLLVAQTNVKQAFSDLEKKFKYYRLSLYTFSLSSLMEIMLSGNFKEEYITGIKDEIREMTEAYRTLFEKSSMYLEKMGSSALEANVLKGVGTAGKAVGKFIGSIPLIKEGQVDEFLRDGGAHLKESAVGMEKEAVHRFASISNPGTLVFVDKMDDMIQIYNHTEQICFDDKRIYLLPSKEAV
jgi:hypothetical protein